MTSKTYFDWIQKNEPSFTEVMVQKDVKLPINPKISIIIPTFNTPKKILIDALVSVITQTYSNWEICIADGNSSDRLTIETLKVYSKKYPEDKIKIKFLNENKGIVGNTNEALSLATGDYITFLDHDDTLAKFALFEVVKAIYEFEEPDFIYSDEDKITEVGNSRVEPHLKPGWSPDTLRSYNYICHLSVYKKSLLDKIGFLREGFEGSQDYDLVLRATEQANKIVHIPKILYHWRISKNSTAGDQTSKMYAYDSAKKALSEHLMRIKRPGQVSDGMFLSSYKIEYYLKQSPLVSIIIPNHNQKATLETCINSILTKTIYPNYEIIIVENSSTDKEIFDYYDELKKIKNIKIIEWESTNGFNFAAINNYVVDYTKGEHLLFLNNDIEVINPDWLNRMVEYIVREDVGIVGAKLYYTDGAIQHAGVMIGMGPVAGHPYCKQPKNSLGYMGRLKIVQNLMCVTGACLLTKKSIFKELGGFDEKFVLAFNDVDYCTNVHEHGYRIVWTPYAELYHYESKTRGYEDTKEKQDRFWREVDIYRDKWVSVLKKGDPYFYRKESYART